MASCETENKTKLKILFYFKKIGFKKPTKSSPKSARSMSSSPPLFSSLFQEIFLYFHTKKYHKNYLFTASSSSSSSSASLYIWTKKVFFLKFLKLIFAFFWGGAYRVWKEFKVKDGRLLLLVLSNFNLRGNYFLFRQLSIPQKIKY